MIMTFHLPIHMTDRSGDSLSPVAIRTSGSVVGEGRLRFKSGRCTISRSKSLPAQVDATAEIFETGFAFVWRLFRQHPLMRRIAIRLPKESLAVRFVEDNDRVAAIIPPAASRRRPTLELDSTWAPSTPATAGAHLAGLMLLGTISFLEPRCDRRRAIHRLFDLYRLLGEGERHDLLGFMRSSPVDCGVKVSTSKILVFLFQPLLAFFTFWA